jgi:hypothetical protein
MLGVQPVLTGNPADMAAPIEAAVVPWLCVPGFRRVCPYTVSEARLTSRATKFIERFVPRIARRLDARLTAVNGPLSDSSAGSGQRRGGETTCLSTTSYTSDYGGG